MGCNERRSASWIAVLALAVACGSTGNEKKDPNAFPVGGGGSETSGAGNVNTAGETVSRGGTAGTVIGAGGQERAGSGGDTAQGGEGPVFCNSLTNYQLTGTWPALAAAIATVPGTLTYESVLVSDRFLAESCSIADYNKDGHPDISAGRRWYEGPEFTTEHIFRDGHDDMPRSGAYIELDTGNADDWADFPWDVNGDCFTDIINIAHPFVGTGSLDPAATPQPAATAYWYANPGSGWEADPKWTPHLIHDDVSHEQRGIADVNGDGMPEIFAACKDCMPAQTKGYYAADWRDPSGVWTYTAVTDTFEFPYFGTGAMHGLGFGDVDGDGLPDMLDRIGAWIQDPEGGPWTLLAQTLYDGEVHETRGGAHMFAWDIDGDGDQDIFSADWAHGYGLAWYERYEPEQAFLAPFIRHQIIGLPEESELTFSQPHAAQAVDMDGDGIRDIVTGKTRFAHPIGGGDPDNMGDPVIYVFKTVRDEPGVSGAAHFEPYLVDDVAGVGRQIGVGHANLDGIMDICVATKVGIYVFLGH